LSGWRTSSVDCETISPHKYALPFHDNNSKGEDEDVSQIQRNRIGYPRTEIGKPPSAIGKNKLNGYDTGS